MEWGVGGGGGEGAGGCGHALAAFKYSLNIQKMRARWGGEVWARIGSLFILSKHLGNASQVWVVGVVRARGGVGTHWQPLNTL